VSYFSGVCFRSDLLSRRAAVLAGQRRKRYNILSSSFIIHKSQIIGHLFCPRHLSNSVIIITIIMFLFCG
jgi:hypothetical protein